jgi:hypothetical protein
MRTELHPYDVVHVCLPAPAGSSGEDEIVLDGWVASVTTKTKCRIIIDTHGREITIPSARFLIRKSTPLGLLEFDAVGESHHADDRLTLTVDLVGASRDVQRRDSCRIGLGSVARYRNLSAPAPHVESAWKSAVLHDVSLGGASIRIQDENLEMGQELMVEFTLSGTLFTMPAVVCRVGESASGTRGCCSVQFMDVKIPVQDRMARALTQAQLKIISSRVKTE